MYTLLSIFVLAANTVHICAQSCNYVRHLPVKHRDLESSHWDSTSITGCISDTSFKTKIVEDINITCDIVVVPKLERYFITNMTSLKIILIDSCHIETIEPGAFLNLPELRTVKIEGNPLNTISRGVFDVLPSIQKLYIYYNKIAYVEDHAFANLPNLKQFSLEANRLDQLKREWFTNTSNIEHFLIDRNLLRGIPPDMFHGWKNLKELNLNHNVISFIEDGTFKDGAPTVEYLALHHNRITSLSPNVFSSSVFIENLFISGNLLNYLSKEFLEKIRVNNIYIFGNPFTCPCLDRIHKIFLERDVTVDDPTDTDYVKACKMSDVPVCGYSSNSSQTCKDSVDKEVTRKLIAQMKKSGYDSVRTEDGYQCAVFDYDD